MPEQEPSHIHIPRPSRKGQVVEAALPAVLSETTLPSHDVIYTVGSSVEVPKAATE